ncbi:Cys-Gln thioester bond-forming surface protein [Tautonia sociabilis]|uniref:PEP-CTERM sorting domain-containing protein n=1 Tax=Tautonia sociabilis TaxID=2080755 RepID=A0A432MN50_9BACT|nr:Cys-Gln thioester bond-forming surface protein [Tautonia sociabilis]RUL88730.1 PEP-CTERM sorting domain-containing protein [Tautonia sociabilis]
MKRPPSGTRAAWPDRRKSPRLVLAAALALVCVALVPGSARAGMQLQASTTFNGGIGVTAHYNNGLPSPNQIAFSVSTQAGSFSSSWTTANPFGSANSPFLTYCVDISTFLASGQVVTALVSTTNGTAADQRQVTRNIGAAGWVFNNFANQALAALESFSGLSSGSLSQQEAQAAMQLAIWEAAYDTNGASSGALGYLGGGALTFSGTATGNSDVVTLANAILNARNTDSSGISTIGFIDYPPNSIAATPTNQDQIFGIPEGVQINAVPEPSTLAMAAAGALVGLGAMLRRRSKRPAPLG